MSIRETGRCYPAGPARPTDPCRVVHLDKCVLASGGRDPLMDRRIKALVCAAPPAARLRQRPSFAHGACRAPSAPPLGAARSKVEHGTVRSGQAAQDGGGWSLRGALGCRPREGRVVEDEGRLPMIFWRPLAPVSECLTVRCLAE